MLAPARRRTVLLRNALGIATAAAAIGAAPAAAQSGTGAAYTQTNGPSGNQVVAFSRHADGTLTELQRASTRGVGTTMQPPFGFPIVDSSGSINLTKNHRLLFVVNSGDNTVTSFRVTGSGALAYADRVDSGGVLPISLTSNASGRVLYVLNEISGNIAGLHVSRSGVMTPIANSEQPLNPPGAGGVSAQIGFERGDHVLAVTQRLAGPQGVIDTFVLRHNNTPRPAQAHPSPVPTPFGFAPQGRANLIVSDADVVGDKDPFNFAIFIGAVSSFRASRSGGLTDIDHKPTMGRAACWVVITKDQRFAFLTNTLSTTQPGGGQGAISQFAVSSSGTLTMVGQTSTSPGFPSDEALSTGSRYLYVAVPSIMPGVPFKSTVDAYRVGSGGSLTLVGATNDALPAGLSGMAAY